MNAGNEKKVESEEIEIHSQELKHLIGDTDMRFSGLNDDKQPITMQNPFEAFVWSWDTYTKACEPHEDDTPARKMAREALKELLQLVKGSEDLVSFFRSRDLLKNSKMVKFEDLWTIFPHGSKVYARSYMNELQMFEVKYCSLPSPSQKEFTAICAASDWNGSKFSTYIYDFYIKSFEGEKLISSLDLFPTEYYCNDEGEYDDSKLKEMLYKRGQKYYDHCMQSPKQYKYDGAVIVSATGLHPLTSKGKGADDLFRLSNKQSDTDSQEINVTSIDMTGNQKRVIVDNYTFLKSGRNPINFGDAPPLGKKLAGTEVNCVCAICKTSPLQRWRPENGDFSEDQVRLMYLPPRLLGFALKDKVWGQFLVDNLTPIGSADDREHMKPFEKELQLETESKEQLMALVAHHKASSSNKLGDGNDNIEANSVDVIEGKGRGLAILLHGPPGVGKTLTAETIAIATRRPLLTVSVAEMGVKAHEAERKLTEVLGDAARWEAVLLMDEADVFVEERRQGDLERNALVSVLLRCLEYYEGIHVLSTRIAELITDDCAGIIILTTNRVRSIDAAVQSRINLAIQYHDLDKDQRLAIYKNRLGYIPDEELEDRKAIEQGLESSPLIKKGQKTNGRQIRNIVTGARGLARSKGEKLALKHLVRVFETTSDFINSMAEVTQKQRIKNELDYDK